MDSDENSNSTGTLEIDLDRDSNTNTSENSQAEMETFSPKTPPLEDQPDVKEEIDDTDSAKLVDRILKSHSTLQMVDRHMTAQCNRIGNLLHSYNRPDSPTPSNNDPFPPKKIALEQNYPDPLYKMQRQLWLQNLLQLKESFGHQVIFLNGKVLWQAQLGNLSGDEGKEEKIEVDAKEEETPKELEVQSPESPDEKKAKQPILSLNVVEPEAPAEKIEKQSCLLLNVVEPEPIALASTSSEQNLTSKSLDITPNKIEKDASITPEQKCEEMKISNIKDSHKELKDTGGVSINLDMDRVKRKLNESTDTTDTNMSSQSHESEDCTQSIDTTRKRKRALDFFEGDTDASSPAFEFSENESSDGEFEHQTRVTKHMDNVSMGIKRLRLQEAKLELDTEDVGEGKDDSAFKRLLMEMEGGLDLNAVSNSQGHCLRKCMVCCTEAKNMKRHTIFSHLTDVWWGVHAESTCWTCQQYHTYQDIRRCEGYYVPSRDFKSLINRHVEFFSFLKDNLECDSDDELLEIVVREQLGSKSVSSFTTYELDYMRIIDRSKGLPGNHLYRAQFPTRITELLHWRSLSSIMNYANLRGVLTSNTMATRPLRYIDTYCNIVEMYKMYNYQGMLAFFPILNNNHTSRYLYKVITDITDPQIFFSQWTRMLLLDRDVKISLGIQPRLALSCSNMFIQEIEQLMFDASVVAIGGIGLDTRFPDTLETQISVFISFLKMATKYQKTVRLNCTGAHNLCMQLMQQHLPNWQLIHYLNFSGTIDEAKSFLLKFPNSFLGISGNSVEPSKTAESMMRAIPITRLVPGSNAPFTSRPTQNASLPTDVGEIIYRVSIIKGMTVQEVARQFRHNTSHLYGI